MADDLTIGGMRITGLAPVLIAGTTASGKSGLARAVARATGGTIVNADALQVYGGWRILTARPSDVDISQAPHALYGHVPRDETYSVGDWLAEVGRLVATAIGPLIITGGTGLYFRALTEGLAEIPPIPGRIHDLALAGDPAELVTDLDARTAARIDLQNPRRVQRAWEVLQATGRGLADWQDATPPPLIPLGRCQPIFLDADRDWLNDRIARRFRQMMAAGALDEARAMLPNWDPARQSSQAIGARELIAHLCGDLTLDEATEAAIIATRQYAKRQRTWFRAHMAEWVRIDPATL